jgi:prepilin-type N-terminal cleavage/methylation domain-containing protein
MMKCSAIDQSTVGSGWRRQRGFTLAEMMVVLAVITLIVGVTIPNLRRSAVRAELLGEVQMVRQALAVARIHAVKNSRRVALQLLPDDEQAYQDLEPFAWVDDNANDLFDSGEVVVGQWPIAQQIFMGIDDSSKKADALHEFGGAGPPLGVVFLPTGTAITTGSSIGVGQAGVIISDKYDNRIRLTIQGGAGTIVEEMWDFYEEDWSTQFRYWRY